MAIFFIGQAIDLACGPEPDPYDYSVSFFRNDIAGGKAYRAFYFTSSQLLYTSDEPASEEEINSREWVAYLGGNVKPADVKRVMYHLDHKTDSVLLTGYLNLKNNIPDSLRRNTFLHALRKKKAALLYYRLTKIVEPAVGNDYYWRATVDTNYLFKTANDALKEASLAKSKFLKLRYYFQAQRLFHYSYHQEEARNVYDRHIANMHPAYYIKGLTLALRAGEERWIGNPAKSAYLFSKLFTYFPERRSLAYRDYTQIDVPEGKVLAFARNDYERAVIYVMKGFYNHRLSTQYLR